MRMIQTAESRYNHRVRGHHRFLLRSARALTGSRVLAEDVVQALAQPATPEAAAAPAQ